jgi:hypothetical protein
MLTFQLSAETQFSVRVSPFEIDVTAPSQNYSRIAGQVEGVACAMSKGDEYVAGCDDIEELE